MRQGENASRSAPDPLERGRFSDGRRRFAVRASSENAPDSFQVYADGNPADIVVVIAGLTSWDLHATWGEGWRSASAEWKEWCQDQAFLAFYNGRPPVPGRTRVCNG
ncbi:hypothetical protein [Glycomyces albidus]|uniref:Uncharacterized protein n=1 Tax=Glycomyces albidus TaxID=2656774 RepID=A0A6L5G5W5_9ACTN|nr:hypothetical protein [Glycomyces albidus]MQM25039.1 hypothetical protein [Glycomyces albidus]